MTTHNMKFQVLNIYSHDEDIGEEEDEDVKLQHVIHLFGRNENGQTVGVKTIFSPYFFVEIPTNWSMTQVQMLISTMKGLVYPKDDAVSFTPVTRKKFYGFTNGAKFRFIRCVHKSKKGMSFLSRKLSDGIEFQGKKRSFEVYESNIEPALRFLHINDLQACGWVEVDPLKSKKTEEPVSKCDIDLFVPSFRDFSPATSEVSAPFVIASFDIEVFSHDGSFPSPQVKENVVFQVATTLQRYGEAEPFLKHIVCLHDTNPIDDVEMKVVQTERELLLEWTRFINREQVDVLLGYNIWGFDFKYMFERAKITGCLGAFSSFSKLEDYSCSMIKKTFSSGAYGTTDHELPVTPGVFQIDLLVVMRREYKLESYKLDSVAEHFLKENKLDVSPKQIFEWFKGTSEDRNRVAQYCVQDVALPLRLLDKLAIFMNLVEMANVTYVPIDYLILRGQQIKCFSQIARETRKRDMVIKVLSKNNGPQEFQGATVLEPKRGFYKSAVSCLDFASLYPSIMRAHKLCHSNWVNSKDMLNLPDVEYYTMEWYDENDELHRHVFAQNEDGVLPGILEELAKSRKRAKKDMANSKTKFEKAIYNGKQLAYKVSMNSLYGFCGAIKTGMLPCKAISETVTARGRQMIEETKEFVEREYPGAKVVYGDSVTGDTPVILRDPSGSVFTSRIDEIEGMYTPYHSDKEAFMPAQDLQVWTEKGFTNLNRVIRHKTQKKMYRVLTHFGIVDCTEDHSLLNDKAEKVAPGSLQIGDLLLHSDSYPTCEHHDRASESEAKIMGFFFGDGSCGVYGEGANIKYSWALNNADISILRELQPLCPFSTKILDTMASSGVYKLVATGDVESVVVRYRKMFYNTSKEKKVPPCILSGDAVTKKNFMEGYYLADGDKSGCYRFCCKGKEGALGLSMIASELGFKCSINTHKDKPDIFRITCTKGSLRKNPHAIKKLIPLPDVSTFVYDLETESHHFHVGPGTMVVHNTDSVFCSFEGYLTGKDIDPKDIKNHFDVATDAGERCTKELFPKPNELEFEKVYSPLLLMNKKRYIGNMYDAGDHSKPAYIDVKGFTVARRDTTPFTKEVCWDVINTLMKDVNMMKARHIAKGHVQELLDGKIPFEKLILSKSLRDTYKNENVPHLAVARKIESRNPGSGPKTPERVPYVFVESQEKEQFKKAEDPTYAKENNLKLDSMYYLKHQLQKPLESIFEWLTEDSTTMFDDQIRRHTNKKKGQKEISSFFNLKKK